MTEPWRQVCQAVADADWALLEERADETVRCAEVEFMPGDWPKDAWPLRYLVLQIRKKQGRLLRVSADAEALRASSPPAPALARGRPRLAPPERAASIPAVHHGPHVGSPQARYVDPRADAAFPASTSGQHVITAPTTNGPSKQWTVDVDP